KKSVKKPAKKAKAGKPASTSKAKNAAPPPAKPSAPKRVAKPAAPRTKPAPVATAPATSRGNIYYITTAIAYPNGQPHIGHAYEAIATDALARFARLDSKDVFFLTGTDEHGLKMIQAAEAEQLPTLQVATRNA